MVKETHKVLEQDGHGSRWTFAVTIFSSHKGILHKNHDKAYIYIYIIDNLQLPSFPIHFFLSSFYPRLIFTLQLPSRRPQEGLLRVSCLAHVRQVRSSCVERSCTMGQVAPARPVKGWFWWVFREKHVVLVPHPPPPKKKVGG